MISNKDTFNVNKVAIPFSSEDLEKIISKNVINGYVLTTYDKLLETLTNIQSASELEVTLNPNSIFNNVNNPLTHSDVLIKVEGIQTYKEFVNTVIKTDESDKQWINFITYSINFKDEIKNIKLNAFKKYLWNYHNIDNWFNNHNISLLNDDKNSLTIDFNLFKSNVLDTEDYIKFIDECNEEDILKATKYIISAAKQLLQKYNTELNRHIAVNTKREEIIILKNPIILNIFLQGNAIQQCKKDWPRIKFTPLDKKSFTTIGLWET